MKRQAVFFVFLAVLFCLPALPQNPDLHDVFMAEGSMDQVRIQSVSLENNFLGDRSERDLSIYLPPGYEDAPDSHYPVLYLLHGYSGYHSTFFYGKTYNFNLKYMLDTLINRNILTPLIVVCPNAYNKYFGSWYANSSVSGKWEDFITKDLIEYMDSHYRTVAGSGGRGISGHSMGGHGSFRIGMKHPDLYAAVYPMSGVINLRVHLTENMSHLLKARQADNFNTAEWLSKLMISEAAAFAPDSAKTPFYGQFPVDASGVFIDSIWTRWMEQDPFSLLETYKDSIAKLRALQFDCGIHDVEIYDENLSVSAEMTNLGIDHVFLEYEGDHGNKIEERMREHVLPFFSRHLDHGIPGISRISASYLGITDTLVVELDQDGMVYLVPEHTIASLESINKSQLDSKAGEANSEIRLPLSAIGKGHYIIYGIRDEDHGISIPLPLVVDTKVTPPELTVLADSVNRGDSIYVQSDKDGMIYLAVKGTLPSEIPSRRVMAEAEVKAGIPVGIPTAGLPRSDFLLYAKDEAGLISLACQVCIFQSSGQEQFPTSGIKIYPNPTHQILNIEAKSSGYHSLDIKSLNGQILYSAEFNSSTHQVDLSSINKGIYLITIRSKYRTQSRKIVKL